MRLTLIAVQSLDGFITKHDTPGSAFASSADQAHLSRALKNFDFSIMGGETYRQTRAFIRERMTHPRLRGILTRQPGAYADDVLPGTLEFFSTPPRELLASFAARGLNNGALLGGAQMHSLFLDAGLIDEIWLTVEPVLFGSGTPLLIQKTDTRLRLLGSENLSGHTLLLRYEVQR